MVLMNAPLSGYGENEVESLDTTSYYSGIRISSGWNVATIVPEANNDLAVFVPYLSKTWLDACTNGAVLDTRMETK